MANFFLGLTFFGLFYLALSSTLHDITKADCRAGVELAFQQLFK